MTDPYENIPGRHRFGDTASDLLDPADDPRNWTVTAMPAGQPRSSLRWVILALVVAVVWWLA